MVRINKKKVPGLQFWNEGHSDSNLENIYCSIFLIILSSIFTDMTTFNIYSLILNFQGG